MQPSDLVTELRKMLSLTRYCRYCLVGHEHVHSLNCTLMLKLGELEAALAEAPPLTYPDPKDDWGDGMSDIGFDKTITCDGSGIITLDKQCLPKHNPYARKAGRNCICEVCPGCSACTPDDADIDEFAPPRTTKWPKSVLSILRKKAAESDAIVKSWPRATATTPEMRELLATGGKVGCYCTQNT